MDDNAVSDEVLKKQFKMYWPEFAATLSDFPHQPPNAIPKERDMRDMVAEILELARAEAIEQSNRAYVVVGGYGAGGYGK